MRRATLLFFADSDVNLDRQLAALSYQVTVVSSGGMNRVLIVHILWLSLLSFKSGEYQLAEPTGIQLPATTLVLFVHRLSTGIPVPRDWRQSVLHRRPSSTLLPRHRGRAPRSAAQAQGKRACRTNGALRPRCPHIRIRHSPRLTATRNTARRCRLAMLTP